MKKHFPFWAVIKVFTFQPGFQLSSVAAPPCPRVTVACCYRTLAGCDLLCDLHWRKGKKSWEMEAHEVAPDVVDILPSNVMEVSFT